MTTLPSAYGPLVRELLERAGARRQPADGSFELTSRCNLACRMCYIRQTGAAGTPREPELPASAWVALAREGVDNGLAFLLLTGGEPLLRSDFFEIFEPLTRLGLYLTLFTNGTLVTPEVARRLAAAPPSRTEITLYGATAATYEAITGVPGSFTRCCAGIEALLEQGVALNLKSTLTRMNIGELEAMRELAHGWGLPFSAAWLLSRRRDGGVSEVEECRLSPAECVAHEAADQASAAEWNESVLRGAVPADEKNFYCEAGRAAFVINPVGEMNVCMDLPRPAARPLEIGFAAAWQQVVQYVESAPPLCEACQACEVRSFCPRCPAWSLLETGTLNEPVPYLCEIAYLRRDHYERSR